MACVSKKNPSGGYTIVGSRHDVLAIALYQQLPHTYRTKLIRLMRIILADQKAKVIPLRRPKQ